MLRFTHLLVEAKSKYSPNLKPYAKTHNILASVDGFAEIAMNHQIFPPVRIKTKPLIFILERNSDVVVPEIEEESTEEAPVGDEIGLEGVVDEKIEVETEEDSRLQQQDPIISKIPITVKATEQSKYLENNEEDSFSEENFSDEAENTIQPIHETNQGAGLSSKETVDETVPENTEHDEETTDENQSFQEENNLPELPQEVEAGLPRTETTKAAFEENDYDSQDENDLFATESNERLVESLDFRPIVEDLEKRLKLNSGNIDQVLLNDDVISYIKALTKVEYNGRQDIDKLRKALSSILNGFQDGNNAFSQQNEMSDEP